MPLELLIASLNMSPSIWQSADTDKGVDFQKYDIEVYNIAASAGETNVHHYRKKIDAVQWHA